MYRPRLLIDGETLRLEEILQVAQDEVTVELSPEAEQCVRASRELVEKVAAGDAPSYGINTGFGTLAEVRIDKKDLAELQRNLVLSHSGGTGEALGDDGARWLHDRHSVYGVLARTRLAGNTMAKREPLPSTDWMRSSAPWRCTTCLTMDSPRPVPPVSRARLPSTR